MIGIAEVIPRGAELHDFERSRAHRLCALHTRPPLRGKAVLQSIKLPFLHSSTLAGRLLLLLAVVAGFGQARHIKFYRIAALIAPGCKATKDETAQTQNNAAHRSSPELARGGVAARWVSSSPCAKRAPSGTAGP